MDRTELSSAIIQEMQVLVGDALAAVVPALLTVDLATLEQQVQQVGRVILGGLVERVAAGQGQGLPRPARCPDCHGPLKRRERPRPLVGLVGDYTLHRAYYWCAACKRGTAPLDAALGLGPGDVSPGLARVVARAAVDATFTPAVDLMQEALGATLSDETARRLAERIGAAAFAVESIRRWWRHHGQDTYPAAQELLIVADGGGSNSACGRLWKTELQGLATETGLTLRVSHLPPGTSKWNKIEHKLFSYISINWRARPLSSMETVLELISRTTTTGGLTVAAVVDTHAYPTKISVSDAEIHALHLVRDPFHGDWNYALHPL